ncbi:MAG: peptidoglycan bridge formation glycyltransferase FemA/FemB family protein [Nostocaceae cyanobacterium]|nr:peptidoglycan bridge formation glycyltransferase FemA/FemB family protein [Nostocaceae cyanobacterium]
MKIELIQSTNFLWFDTLKKLRYDIYQLPDYVEIEANRTNCRAEAIIISNDEDILFIPYLLRSCNDLLLEAEELFDVVSPYGYPGFLLSQTATENSLFVKMAIEQFKLTLKNRKVCSAFLRMHPILNPNLEQLLDPGDYQIRGETVSINLELSEAELWSQTRNDHRTGIHRCQKLGMVAKMVPLQQHIPDFIQIYNQTMERVQAKELYYFNDDYFFKLSQMVDNIHLCIVEFENEIAAAGLFTESCNIVQFHLSGTKNKYLKQAPSKLMLHYVRHWAKKRGNKVFNLGGGVGSSKDKLYQFKAGFSQITYPFMTVSLIINPEKYKHLVELRAQYLNTNFQQLFNSQFFPAYRSLAVT